MNHHSTTPSALGVLPAPKAPPRHARAVQKRVFARLQPEAFMISMSGFVLARW